MLQLIKSMFSFSWAMSLFGAQQVGRLLSGSSVSGSFENVAGATKRELEGVAEKAFLAVDRVQRQIVDEALRILPGEPSAETSDRSDTPRAAKSASGVADRPPDKVPTPTPRPAPRVNSGRLNRSSFITLGEGLAAGMGNFTLSEETQRMSFPAQMAAQMQADFPQTLIQAPGLGDAPGFTRLPVRVPAFQQTTVLDHLPPESSANLSVPGLTLSDALRLRPTQPVVNRDDSKQTAVNLILGARTLIGGERDRPATQLECAIERQPTFAIIELGYYEVLEAAVSGDITMLPNVDTFRLDYKQLLRTLKDTGSELLATTIPDPMDTAHFSSIETASRILKVKPDFILNTYRLADDDLVTVNGLNEIGYQLFGNAIKPLAERLVAGAGFGRDISDRVSALNDEITRMARAEGTLIYDLHALFQRLRLEGLSVGSRRLTAQFLGGFYLLNGYYPGETGHAIIANELIHSLNDAYGADFPEVDAQTVLRTDPAAEYQQAQGPNWSLNELPHPSNHSASEDTDHRLSKAKPDARRRRLQGASEWRPLPGYETPATTLRLPPRLEQVLPLSKAASYFGDGIGAINCRDEQGIEFGSCDSLLFGGLAMVDSHLTGSIRIKFSPPLENISDFEIYFEGGFEGEDGILAAPQFFRMPFQGNRVDAVPGLISSGKLDLRTGEAVLGPAGAMVTVFATYTSRALTALASVNPSFPLLPGSRDKAGPIAFPGPYGSAWVRFEQRPDDLLDFTFYGSTFVPLRKGIRWPLNFVGPSGQFATIPAQGTVMHPHLALSTKEPEASLGLEDLSKFPFNTVQELTLFTHNSSFGDRFGLDIEEWGGEATGRSHVLGRVQLQIGERSGNSVPVAVNHLQPGGLFEPFASTPVTQLFPAPLPAGPSGFNEFLRFPLRTYSLNDLAILDDPFDLSVGSVDLATGSFLHPLLHRAFINQDLIFALIRVAPDSAKTFFLFRGPARIEMGSSNRLTFRFRGSVTIPFPEGMEFPKPDLATGYVNSGKQAVLDPFLWIHAIADCENVKIKQGSGDNVLASTGDRFSYRYEIPFDPANQKPVFEYENHSQKGKYLMHTLSWVAFSNSGDSIPGSRDCDTVTFGGFGIWSKDGIESSKQASAQFSTSSERPYVGIQIGAGFVSNVNTKPQLSKDALP